jgi:hypothetical protein
MISISSGKYYQTLDVAQGRTILDNINTIQKFINGEQLEEP